MSFLYIPTTTLNFNNIFATEAISPASFYEQRGFGYRHFEEVEPNPFRNMNIILLYSRLPVFDITDNERDNHPMVFRIDKNSLPPNSLKVLKEQDGISVYGYNQTIYLDPISVQLNFFSEEEMKIALSKSEPSLTTKMVKLYRQSFRIADRSSADGFLWKADILDGINEAAECIDKFTNKDLHVNRLKGFAYAYVLGAYKSTSPALAKHLSELRALKNKASALLNDLSNRIDEGKKGEIFRLYSSLESKLAVIGNGAERYDPSQGDNISIIDSALKLKQVNDKHLSDPRAADFLVSFINDYCLECDFYADLAEDRNNVAMGGAQTIKAIIGIQWEGSPHKVFINALLNNVKNGSAFDLGSVDSLALKSFAVFILKGDDLEKLEDFLVANGIGDFRIAFALWGAMFGFSKIPKNYFNLLFECENAGYAMAVYKHIQQAIHGKTNEFDMPILPITPRPDCSEKEDKPGSYFLNRLFRKYPGTKQWEEKLLSLLNNCGGMNSKFSKMFINKTTVKDLGGSVAGVSKSDVNDFIKKELNPHQGKLFLSPSYPQMKAKFFYADDGVWDNIQALMPEEDRKKVKKTLEWFQNQWSDPKSKYYGWENQEAPKGNPRKTPLSERTNNDAIIACCKTLKRNADADDSVIDKIRQTLLHWYNDAPN
jgi:hypothetical protein